jgi:hypothetical protein
MKYRVITRVVETCIYEVEANDPKEAEAKSCDASPYETETESEETLSITPIQPTNCWKCGRTLETRLSDGLLPMHRIPRAHRSQRGPLPTCPGSQTKPRRAEPQPAEPK